MPEHRSGDGIRRVVVLAGSAGALPTILQQLTQLKFTDTSALFVVYHRAGEHDFPMADYAKGSRFKVVSAVDGEVVKTNHVYYPRRSLDLDVKDGRLRVSKPEGGSHPSIDRLLVSLAQEYGDRVVAVILSGSAGRDGIEGMEAVRAAGGHVIVLDPAEAVFPQLSEAAMESGFRSHVMGLSQLHATVEDLMRK